MFLQLPLVGGGRLSIDSEIITFLEARFRRTLPSIPALTFFIQERSQ